MRVNHSFHKKAIAFAGIIFYGLTASAQVTPVSQMEHLSRGLVVVPGSTSGQFVSWRFLGTDDEDATTFDILRDGKVIRSNLSDATSYTDAAGKTTNKYQVVTKVNGVPVDTTAEVTPWTDVYMQLPLDRPANGTNSDGGYSYSPNDCSVGDVDGDGEYEIIVKWDPSNSKDNSQGGLTGNVYLDCYKLDGTKLWRIDLGVNIRAGAHYTQFMVYDFDGDGKAELMCKTAPGSKDGAGVYVNQAATESEIKSASNTKDWRNSDGRVTGGQEYLTVFNGETGKAIHTVFYNPNRNQGYGGEADGSFNWGTPDGKNDKGSYGNRGERFLAAVAYLDGPDHNPSGIFSRGYYGYAFIWAVDFDGKEIKQRWLHASTAKNSYTRYGATSAEKKSYVARTSTAGEGRNTMFANGNHNLSIADVDGDGKDEIIWGSAALDDDGLLLYAVGFGHGDAIHLGDFDPDRPGLELFDIHEDKGTYSWDLHDAGTGEIIFKGGNSGVDNGRGIAAQLSDSHRGAFFSSSDDRSQRSAVTGQVISSKSTSMNFRIYWDGDLQDELLDGNQIDKWNGNGTTRLYIRGKNPYGYGSSSTCNSTKKTPNLQADIFGDWREELILWDSSNSATLNIFSSAEPTNYRVPTLMHDHVYRMGVAWQNVAYNQPPHLGYYLPDRFKTRFTMVGDSPKEQRVALGDSIVPITIAYKYCTVASVDSTFTPSGRVKGLDPCFKFSSSFASKTITITGKPDQEGTYEFLIRGTGNTVVNANAYEIVRVIVTDPAGVSTVPVQTENNARIYTVSGMQIKGETLESLPQGIYIIREGCQTKKVLKK